MKKFIIVACILVALVFGGYQAYYRLGFYLDLNGSVPVDTFIKTEGKEFRIRQADGSFAPFEIRGIDLGSGMPGEWAPDFAIDKQTYKRWFGYIQELGINTIRVYTISNDTLYNAFYEYNTEREAEGKEPLYMLHGVWVNDYVFNSHASAYDPEFLDTFLDDCHTLVDVLHGRLNLNLGYQGVGSGIYRHDVSKWVLGYILGVEWETSLVTYTNQVEADKNSYTGDYLYTTEDASPFEAMLAQVGDHMIEYETNRYRQQRLVAFSNWPTTDPFTYPLVVAAYRYKSKAVNVEHIQATDAYQSGMFASYHVYPYYPDYLQTVLDGESFTEEEVLDAYGKMGMEVLEYRASLENAPSILDYVRPEDYHDSKGRLNTYLAYLKALNRFHTIPVVISEYGITTGRGMAQEDENTHRNQGHMNEQEQGQALIECYEDIMDAGCAGSCLFSWQDEWFKRTWNTLYAVDSDKNAYWSDYQTNEQFFGLLTFDPGKEKSVCYVDGDISEWGEDDLVTTNGDIDLSMKYDEKFLYFLIHKQDLDRYNDTLYIPIDTNPKVGSTYCRADDVSFERPADFLMVLHGRYGSRLLVQERYEVLMSTYHTEYYGIDPYYEGFTPGIHSPVFKPIYMALKLRGILPEKDTTKITAENYETGKLRYGNANPDSPNFDSLADFILAGDYVEVRIPWQLLNFSDPSDMMIHDDYYECYGIENYHIGEMYVGVGAKADTTYRIPMAPFALKGWGKNVTYHERLKRSYFILKDYWASLD